METFRCCIFKDCRFITLKIKNKLHKPSDCQGKVFNLVLNVKIYRLYVRTFSCIALFKKMDGDLGICQEIQKTKFDKILFITHHTKKLCHYVAEVNVVCRAIKKCLLYALVFRTRKIIKNLKSMYSVIVLILVYGSLSSCQRWRFVCAWQLHKLPNYYMSLVEFLPMARTTEIRDWVLS